MTELSDLSLHLKLVAFEAVAGNPTVPLEERLRLTGYVAAKRRDLILEALEGHRKCLEEPLAGHRCDLGDEIRRILGASDSE